MYIGEFCSMGDWYEFNNQVVKFDTGERTKFEHTLLEELVPCRSCSNQVLHRRTAVKLNVLRRHSFSAEQTHSIDMAKMCMGYEQVIDFRNPENAELATKVSRCFEQNGFSFIGFDTQRNRASDIL